VAALGIETGEPTVLEASAAWPSAEDREIIGARTEVVVTEAEREPMLAAASVGAVSPSASSPAEASAPSPSFWISVVPWIVVILVVGALLGLASVLLAFAALRRQLAGRRPLGEGMLATLLDGLRRRAGIGRPVRLTVAPRVQVPMAVGVLRPEIVVPPKVAQGLPPAHQESLLAHELAHVLRRDPAWRLAALLVERVFFFQPLNRLASRRVAQSAEYLCDDWAARHTRQPLALASCLTEIATWVARTGPVPATMAGPRSILGRRVQRLLQPARASARPWWLSAALGLPLLGVVAVAPGVDTQAHAKGDRKGAERIVVIDEDGRRHELRPAEGGAIVVQERDGALVVRSLDERTAPAIAGDDASPRQARQAAREQERARDKARRAARKELRRAFRTAKARGDAAPSRAEVEAILRRARVASGSAPEHVDVRVVVPGHFALHGRVPVDVDALEEILRGLEGLEDLGSMLEGLEALEGLEGLEALEGLDVVIVHPRPGHPERARAEHLHGREHAEARREAVRIRQEAKRMQKEALRRHAEHDAAREEAKRMQKEAIRREIERAHRERTRHAPSELPTVRGPAPEAPLARSVSVPVPPRIGETPVAPAPPALPERVRRMRVPAPPAPRAPLPPPVPSAPTPPAAPQPDVGPVVWVSSPPPTMAAGHVATAG
jgi:beta-lactamase regulating signal transducer with metallopeptidase domain